MVELSTEKLVLVAARKRSRSLQTSGAGTRKKDEAGTLVVGRRFLRPIQSILKYKCLKFTERCT